MAKLSEVFNNKILESSIEYDLPTGAEDRGNPHFESGCEYTLDNLVPKICLDYFEWRKFTENNSPEWANERNDKELFQEFLKDYKG